MKCYSLQKEIKTIFEIVPSQCVKKDSFQLPTKNRQTRGTTMRGKPIGSKENMKNKPYSKFNLESLCQRRGIDKKFYIVIVKCVCLDILFIGVYWFVAWQVPYSVIF